MDRRSARSVVRGIAGQSHLDRFGVVWVRCPPRDGPHRSAIARRTPRQQCDIGTPHLARCVVRSTGTSTRGGLVLALKPGWTTVLAGGSSVVCGGERRSRRVGVCVVGSVVGPLCSAPDFVAATPGPDRAVTVVVAVIVGFRALLFCATQGGPPSLPTVKNIIFCFVIARNNGERVVTLWFGCFRHSFLSRVGAILPLEDATTPSSLLVTPPSLQYKTKVC